jgi:hypothetical protein
MNRPKCTGCTKQISGKINIETRARKLGGKVIHDVLYYCKSCFYKINMERSWNVYRKEEAARKRKNNR